MSVIESYSSNFWGLLSLGPNFSMKPWSKISKNTQIWWFPIFNSDLISAKTLTKISFKSCWKIHFQNNSEIIFTCIKFWSKSWKLRVWNFCQMKGVWLTKAWCKISKASLLGQKMKNWFLLCYKISGKKLCLTTRFLSNW